MDKWNNIKTYTTINNSFIGNPHGAFGNIMDKIRSKHRGIMMSLGIEGKMTSGRIIASFDGVKHLVKERIIKEYSHAR